MEEIKIFDDFEIGFSYFQKILWSLVNVEEEDYIKYADSITTGKTFENVKSDGENFVSSFENLLKKTEKEIINLQEEKLRFETAANRLKNLLKKIKQQ